MSSAVPLPSPAVASVLPPALLRPGAVALVGEALVDVFPDRRVLGGAPFNVARTLGALGLRPLLVARHGDDELGRAIADECARFGVLADGLQCDPTRPTGVVDVHFEGGTHRFAIRADQAWDALDAGTAAAAVALAQPAWICFGTLAQRQSSARSAVRVALETSRARRLLDINLRDMPDAMAVAADSLMLADVLKVNEDELLQLLRWFNPPGDVRMPWLPRTMDARIARLMLRFNLQLLVITRGEQGFAAYEDSGRCVAMGAASEVAVVDTVGAGDAFTSVLLLGLAAGWPLLATLERAGELAAAACTLRGAVAADPAFYRPFLQRWQGAPA